MLVVVQPIQLDLTQYFLIVHRYYHSDVKSIMASMNKVLTKGSTKGESEEEDASQSTKTEL